MPSAFNRLQRLLVLAWLLCGIAAAHVAHAAEPQRVLMIYSYSRDVAPFDDVAAAMRAELARSSPRPIAFFEVTLDAGRSAPAQSEEPFVAYLQGRYGGKPPDLVVTLGGPAARFYTQRRDQLFPATPLVVGAVADVVARGLPLRATDAALAGALDFPALFEHILHLLPDTRTVAVVMGSSELDRFWRKELQIQLAPLSGRIELLWLNDLSLEQMQQRLGQLPKHSAVFYGLLAVDAAGVPHQRPDALAKLHAATNAPIFGMFDTDLGAGVVGGPLASPVRAGRQVAAQALHVLAGTPSATAQVHSIANEAPAYDWRELKRWNIDRARLPSGSEVRFEPPSPWQEHRTAVVATALALAVQAALIVSLLWQRLRRRDAERAAHSLGGRLITAHEDERRRLARELHDDVTQRLAALAIETAALERPDGSAGANPAARSIREGLVDLSEDVHALSYRLHPSVLEDLGLVEALRAECDRVARNAPMRVHLDAPAAPHPLSADTALCMFRVAQEALRNVARHAGASDVEVSLQGQGGGLQLAVRDNGAGFDAARTDRPASLGLASMRERVELLGGKLQVGSTPGRGTAVVAWLPLPSAA